MRKIKSIKDGPPCLQILCKEGFPEGTRSNGLYNLGVYLKKANSDTWQNRFRNLQYKIHEATFKPSTGHD